MGGLGGRGHLIDGPGLIDLHVTISQTLPMKQNAQIGAPEQVERACKEVMGRLGAVTVLVNNGGFTWR